MELAEHWDYILEAAKKRLSNNRSQYHIDEYGTQLEVRGAAGELAARLYFGMEPVLHMHYDGGIDFFYAGKSIDVKTSKLVKSMEHRFLQIPVGKVPAAEIVVSVAVHLNQKRAAMIGWASKEDILRSPINNNRKYPCHEIKYTDLRPIWELITQQSYMDYVKGGRVDESINPI